MQVESLRFIIDEVMSESNKEVRAGIFWCVAEDYDEEVPVFIDFF
jgi:hypothetical protein